jgi:hypothetical protein
MISGNVKNFIHFLVHPIGGYFSPPEDEDFGTPLSDEGDISFSDNYQSFMPHLLNKKYFDKHFLMT